MDLTRLLPLTLEELEEEEKRTGEWSTSYPLSGKAKGATLNVSFGFSLVDDVSKGKVPEVRRAGGLSRRDRARSVEDLKGFQEDLRSSVRDVGSVAGELEDEKLGSDKLGTSEVQDASGDKDSDEQPEFVVIEQGVELGPQNVEVDGVDKGVEVIQNGISAEPDQSLGELSFHDDGRGGSSLLLKEPAVEDPHYVPGSIEIHKSESWPMEVEEHMFSEFKTNWNPGSMMSRSLSLDDSTDSVENEFLSMLGLEESPRHSPFRLSSESDMESPRERLWKKFEKESLAAGDSIFGLDQDSGWGANSGDSDLLSPVGREGKNSGWGGFSGDSDLSAMVHEAESELQKAAQYVDSKSRAKMLEDAETEALMRDWGLNEETFRSSPPGSKGGFGSPIYIPPEEPLELPPLAEGLGPFLQTKDGGFVRSMNPSLFKNAKNKGSLIMQVSSPVVVPAEMGSGIMEILQGLASVGIEKLSMQAKKLMPLEDISGRTMQQASWEAAPPGDTYEREEFSQHMTPDADSGVGFGQNAFSGKKKKGKSSSRGSSGSREMASEYVSLEDLAPLAMDNIEALSIEGLRIQSGMSGGEAPSNIDAKYIDDISAWKGKESNNLRSQGLEGAAGLQLLDVKDNGDDVDGLMGLSITLDEWMKLDSGIVEEDEISDRTSKILAAHHACSTDFVTAGRKGDKSGGKRSGKRWGLLGNNFTVVLMVQLRDPLRDFEPVGTPMLALIQVERVFVPPKPKIYSTVSEMGNSEAEEAERKAKIELSSKEEKKEEDDAIPQFKITEVHVAGLKTEPDKKKVWGNPTQQQSGSRWLLASGMGKSNKNPFTKSMSVKPSQVTTTVQPRANLWSISSHIQGTVSKLKELATLGPHIRNPNVILPN